MKKRRIPKQKQLRNVAYLVWISMALVFAATVGGVVAWAIFTVTAVYFWPQGHYGERGVR